MSLCSGSQVLWNCVRHFSCGQGSLLENYAFICFKKCFALNVASFVIVFQQWMEFNNSSLNEMVQKDNKTGQLIGVVCSHNFWLKFISSFLPVFQRWTLLTKLFGKHEDMRYNELGTLIIQPVHLFEQLYVQKWPAFQRSDPHLSFRRQEGSSIHATEELDAPTLPPQWGRDVLGAFGGQKSNYGGVMPSLYC